MQLARISHQISSQGGAAPGMDTRRAAREGRKRT
jgi:hypothetical protein